MGFYRRLAHFAACGKLTSDQDKEALMPLVFWILAGLLFVTASFLFAGGPEHTASLLDYRAWFLLVAGIVAATLGNVFGSRGSKH